MRIWDIDPARLCRQHLLGEHAELHAIWVILTEDRAGYRDHPETQRWEGKRAALYHRHQALVDEMSTRGVRHASPLDEALADGEPEQDRYVDPPEEQERILRAKGCDCDV